MLLTGNVDEPLVIVSNDDSEIQIAIIESERSG